MYQRGAPVLLGDIEKKKRFLVSEMSSDALLETEDGCLLSKTLKEKLNERHNHEPDSSHQIHDLIIKKDYPKEFFASSSIHTKIVKSDEDIDNEVTSLQEEFKKINKLARKNTELYLSMVRDIDVYVATSMREQEDFSYVADECDKIFKKRKLEGLRLRYFDPTTSVAENSKDKGLIECLMVKCAKVLIYFAGERDSFGKDAEAAMALSLGKPVIYYCKDEKKANLYRDTHPLARLIDFRTGVALGAMITTSIDDVSELLWRIFHNQMQYELKRGDDDSLNLREKLTGSVARL